eukprot:IDg7702t1
MDSNIPEDVSGGDAKTRDLHDRGGDFEVPVVPALPVPTPVAPTIDAETLAHYVAQFQAARASQSWYPSSPAIGRPETIPDGGSGVAPAAMGVP